jgi:hypothetical protein
MKRYRDGEDQEGKAARRAKLRDESMRTALERGVGELISAGAERRLEWGAKHWLLLVERLIVQGRFDEARAVLEHVRPQCTTHRRHEAVERYQRIVDRVPRGSSADTLPAGLVLGGPDVVLARHCGSRGVLIVICPARWIAVALHPLLAERPVNLLYLFDERKFGCLTGVTSLGATYVATLARLQSIVEEFEPDGVYTLGVSKGGFSAIRYGLDLGASGILAFSPLVNLTAEFMAVDGRSPLGRERIRELDPAASVDLRPLIERQAGRPSIHIWYGTGVAVDRLHVGHVADAPGVTTHPLPDVEVHNSLLTVLADGSVETALDDLLGSVSSPDR